MQIFMMARTQTGEGKELKTEYQVAGNVGLLEAQQMLTEIIITSAKAEQKAITEQEATNVQEKGSPPQCRKTQLNVMR